MAIPAVQMVYDLSELFETAKRSHLVNLFRKLKARMVSIDFSEVIHPNNLPSLHISCGCSSAFDE
jgi:hypothetical protein